MLNNRWALPTTVVVALVVAGGLLFQTQQLTNTQTELTAARENIIQLEASATQQGDVLIAQATAAAATEVALLDSAAATQSALQSSAATAQAQAIATQIAQATAAAATEVALLDSAAATQSALQSSAATAQAQAIATQTAGANAAATLQAAAGATQSAQANAGATLAADLALLETQATQSAADAAAMQAALLATATQAAQTIAGLDAQVEDGAAQIAEVLATAQAQATQIADAPSSPSISIDQPVAPVQVEALYAFEWFDDNDRDQWYEGDYEGDGTLEVADGVYRFSYSERRPNYALTSNSVNITEANTLLEYQFRVIGCDENYRLTYIETLFYSTSGDEYALSISCNEVSWSLARWTGEWENLAYSFFNTSDPFFREWHTMSLWFGDGEVTFFLNGVELGSHPMPRGAEGYTYLRMYSEDLATVEFDNLRMWATPITRTTGQLVPVSPDPTPTPEPAVVTESENARQEAALKGMLARFPNDFSIDGEDWELVRLGEIFIWEEGMLAVGVQLINSRGEDAVVLLTAFENPQASAAFWDTASASIASVPPPDALTGFPDSVRIGAYDGNFAVLWWEQTFYTSITIYSRDERTPKRLGDLARWVRDNVMGK